MDGCTEKVVLRERDVRRALTRLAHEVAERNPGGRPVALVGVHRRGAFLARRLKDLLEELLGVDVPLGDLDIGFYRDDISSRPDTPVVHASHIDFDVTGRTVVIVDDVLFTGRTARAAIEALFDYGRPERVQLAVLADRGHRELRDEARAVFANTEAPRDFDTIEVPLPERGPARLVPWSGRRTGAHGSERSATSPAAGAETVPSP